jgi:hypothetical protein
MERVDLIGNAIIATRRPTRRFGGRQLLLDTWAAARWPQSGSAADFCCQIEISNWLLRLPFACCRFGRRFGCGLIRFVPGLRFFLLLFAVVFERFESDAGSFAR